MMIHGAAGGVGSIAVQLAREAGARVVGTAAPPTGTPSSAWARTRASTCRPTGGRTQARSTWCST